MTTYMDAENARELATDLNMSALDTDDWTYEAVEDNDTSYIKVYDETGEYVGDL